MLNIHSQLCPASPKHREMSPQVQPNSVENLVNMILEDKSRNQFESVIVAKFSEGTLGSHAVDNPKDSNQTSGGTSLVQTATETSLSLAPSGDCPPLEKKLEVTTMKQHENNATRGDIESGSVKRYQPLHARTIRVLGEPGNEAIGKRYRARTEACGKPRPLISEKLAFGCALFSTVELDTGMIQKTIIASFATFCCTKSTWHIKWRLRRYSPPTPHSTPCSYIAEIWIPIVYPVVNIPTLIYQLYKQDRTSLAKPDPSARSARV